MLTMPTSPRVQHHIVRRQTTLFAERGNAIPAERSIWKRHGCWQNRCQPSSAHPANMIARPSQESRKPKAIILTVGSRPELSWVTAIQPTIKTASDSHTSWPRLTTPDLLAQHAQCHRLVVLERWGPYAQHESDSPAQKNHPKPTT